ncbi:ribonuclease P protein subunit p21-like [Actinia tenebrosa]|uniref:Ribonuclease P protein subunit p21-like n=1 Tax=Actinia tenebrosa TaxID=6105 RepID=A0A6P8IJZ9_ACTTE|nr:ribonuclease P protein subunit p21-like [Actinia tenebrosa]
MGRKKPTLAANKDAFTRINFLYQAASITLATNPRNTGLVRFYMNSLTSVAQKNVLRLDPSIKRTVCKKCHSLLVPGVTCKVRTKAKRECHVVVTCLCCKKVKRFLSREDYALWSEQNSQAAMKMQPVAQPSKQKLSLKEKQVTLPQEDEKQAKIKQTNEDSTQN